MYRHRGVLKSLGLVLALILAATLLVPAANASTSVTLTSLTSKAVQFLYGEYTQKGISNSENGVGSYALYVLKKAGVDVSSWVYNGQKLEDAVVDAICKDLQNAANVHAKTLAQDLVAAQALGRSDLANQLVEILKHRQTENGFDNNLFSDVPAFDLLGLAGKLKVVNAAYVRDYILSNQLTQPTVPAEIYGAWGVSWTDDKGTPQYFADFMTTAQAVRVLHYLDPSGQDDRVQAAINNGLNWMRKQQQADGSFVAGWDDPAIDTAEVVVTLKALGRDPAEWKSSDGKTAVDYLMNNVLNPDGSFGTSKNAMDATWVLYACYLLSVDIPPRISGSDRILTSVQVSQSSFTSASNVVLATAYNFPDALSATPLAKALSAPILLTGKDTLPAPVEAEIKRLGARTIYLIGGTGVISASLESSLKGKGYTVVRIGGKDRYETSALVARKLAEVLNVTTFTKAYIVTGENFPDGLAAGPLAAAENAPILLVRKDAIPQVIKEILSAYGVKNTVIVGGTAVISDTVKGNLPGPVRIAGADRYGTSVELAKYALSNLSFNTSTVYLATGENYPDALASAAVAGKTRSILLLVNPALPLKQVLADFLTAHKEIDIVKVIGGEMAVPKAVVDEVVRVIK